MRESRSAISNRRAHLALVADDNPGHRATLCAILQALGLRVDTAADGLEAVTALCRRHYDLILMDVSMPNLDGLAASARFRAWEAEHGGGHTPLFMVTSHGSDEDLRASDAAGADGHIVKPIAFLAVVEAVHQAHIGQT